MLRILSLLVPLFVILVPVEVFFMHRCFKTSAWDLGIYHQSLSRLAEFESLNPFLWVYQFKTFNDHFDPIKILVAPLFRLWDSALMLILLDQIAALVGLIPIILWTESILTRSAGLQHRSLIRFTAVFGYLFSEFLWNALFFPSHPTQWAMAFLSWIFYYYERGKFRAGFWVNLFLLFLCKEEFPFLGLTLAAAVWWRKERGVGIRVLAVSLLSLVITFLLRPVLFGDIARHGSFLGLLFSHPAQYFQEWIGSVSSRVIWLPILLMALALSLAGWKRTLDLILVMSAPFAIRLLSLMPAAFGYQYMAIFVPFLIFAFLRGVGAGEEISRSTKRLAWGFIVVTVLGLGLRQAPFHHPFSNTIRYFKDRERYDRRAEVVSGLSNDALKISAPNNWTPHLTNHEYVAMPSVWLGLNGSIAPDVWIWDSRADYYPSKLTMDELQQTARDWLESSADLESVWIDREIELWIKLGANVNLGETIRSIGSSPLG